MTTIIMLTKHNNIIKGQDKCSKSTIYFIQESPKYWKGYPLS